MARHLTHAEAWAAERKAVARRNPSAALPNVIPDDDGWSISLPTWLLIVGGAASLWTVLWALVRFGLPILDRLHTGGF